VENGKCGQEQVWVLPDSWLQQAVSERDDDPEGDLAAILGQKRSLFLSRARFRHGQ
jgi:hypothetical protein